MEINWTKIMCWGQIMKDFECHTNEFKSYFTDSKKPLFSVWLPSQVVALE